jgi:hypothetical protein
MLGARFALFDDCNDWMPVFQKIGNTVNNGKTKSDTSAYSRQQQPLITGDNNGLFAGPPLRELHQQYS